MERVKSVPARETCQVAAHTVGGSLLADTADTSCSLRNHGSHSWCRANRNFTVGSRRAGLIYRYAVCVIGNWNLLLDPLDRGRKPDALDTSLSAQAKSRPESLEEFKVESVRSRDIKRGALGVPVAKNDQPQP